MRLTLRIWLCPQEIDQVRAVSSTEEGLPGQYGRQVERLAGSVASTQQQYQALQSQVGVVILM